MSTNNKQTCLNGTVREFERDWKQSCPTGTVREFERDWKQSHPTGTAREFERDWKQSCPTGTAREFYFETGSKAVPLGLRESSILRLEAKLSHWDCERVLF